MKRILVAGVGNIFFGDDGFGVEVSRRLSERALPEGVQVKDFGIRGLDLTYALLDGWDAAILVDALPRGGDPGTLYVIDPAADAGPPVLDPHAMHPARVLAMARELGGTPPILRVVGCEPGAAEEMQMGLSPAVAAAVDPACTLVEQLAKELSSCTSSESRSR
jgi:hydrogenase maturation protease